MFPFDDVIMFIHWYVDSHAVFRLPVKQHIRIWFDPSDELIIWIRFIYDSILTAEFPVITAPKNQWFAIVL